MVLRHYSGICNFLVLELSALCCASFLLLKCGRAPLWAVLRLVLPFDFPLAGWVVPSLLCGPAWAVLRLVLAYWNCILWPGWAVLRLVLAFRIFLAGYASSLVVALAWAFVVILWSSLEFRTYAHRALLVIVSGWMEPPRRVRSSEASSWCRVLYIGGFIR